jgi:excisionase family DNA binding protein
MSSSDPEQVMTVEQVAAYLQLHRLTVYRYIREGKIPAARIGRLYRVHKSDVDRLLAARAVTSTGRAAGRRRHDPFAGRPSEPAQVRAALQSPVPMRPHEPMGPGEAEVGPRWYDPKTAREMREQDRVASYRLEWDMIRGFH